MSPLQELFTKRVVLMTGKGGVGRSSVTAALATLAQRKGVRVLICDIGDDPSDYSPLARHFGRDRLPPSAELVAPGIKGVVLLARSGQELFLKSVHVAVLNGDIVGTCAWGPSDDRGSAARISALFVSPLFQGAGIGKRLLEDVERDAAQSSAA